MEWVAVRIFHPPRVRCLACGLEHIVPVSGSRMFVETILRLVVDCLQFFLRVRVRAVKTWLVLVPTKTGDTM